MKYVTVFDAATHPLSNWWCPAFGLIFVGRGIFEALNSNSVPFGKRPFRRWGMLAFATVWTFGTGLVVGLDNYRAGNALKTGAYAVVEGPVRNFVPMSPAGHGRESFNVGQAHFAYSDYSLSAGFNNSASFGGPIREGLPVRIGYKNGKILRLEVAR